MNRPAEENDRGSAMIMAIFVLFLLTSVGTALLFLSQNEVKMSQANLNAKRAFYLAEAGLENARLTLWATNDALPNPLDDPFDDDLEAAAGPLSGDVIELTDPEAVLPVWDTSDQLTGLLGVGNDVPLIPITARGNGWFAAYLTNDPLENRASEDDGNERVAIIAIGAGPDRSFEVVEAIIELRPLIPLTPPATVTVLGPPPVIHTGNSNVKDYIGDDCNGIGVPLPPLAMPILGTIGASAEAAAEAGQQPNPDYLSGGLPADATFADLTDPSDPAVQQAGTGTIDPSWTNCGAWQDTLADLKYNADIICTGTCTFPAYGAGRVIFIEGDYDLGPTQSGEGVLVVTGDFIMDGRASWSGVILVVGEGQYSMQGAGNGAMIGSMVVADIAGPDQIYGYSDDCTGGTDGFDTATWNEFGGGNSETTYCSTAIEAATHKPYDVVEFVQR